jgi:hypothetical protein
MLLADILHQADSQVDSQATLGNSSTSHTRAEPKVPAHPE